MVDRLAIAAVRCPSCGVPHNVVQTSGAARAGVLEERFAERGMVGMVAVCSQCGAYVWYNGGVMDLCDDATVARMVPPHILPRIRELAESVRRRRSN